jgi:Zn finger protein HypA/HybF involved in hydrogenase expression
MYKIWCAECDEYYETDMLISECPICMAQNVVLKEGE